MAIATILCSPLFSQAQNVGIGTNTPSARLHVEIPSGFTSPVVQVNQQGSAVPYLIIQPNGNVGIGVASPSEALDVSGNVQFSGALMPGGNAGSAGQVLVSQGPGNAPVWQNAAVVTDTPIVGVGTSTNPIGIMPGTNTGDVLIWNGSQWVIKQAPWDSICNGATANFVQKWTGTELCNSMIFDNGAQIGIGTSSPGSAAILDVYATDKGVLLPRLTLAGYYDVSTTVSPPDTGLIVFHKGIPNMEQGYYYWDGKKWTNTFSINRTQVVFKKVITPCELFNNAWINPSETVTLDPNCKYIQFDGGTPEDGLLLRYKILNKGVLPSIYDGAKYIVEIEVGREVLDKGGSVGKDGDEVYGLSDSTKGIAFTIPDGWFYMYYILTYTSGSSITSSTIYSIDGYVVNDTPPQRKYAKVTFSLDSVGTFGSYAMAHTFNDVISGFSPDKIDFGDGIYFEMYKGHPSSGPDTDERVRLKYIEITITLEF